MMAACLMGFASWAQDVISIGTAEELAAFAESVNGGKNSLNAVLTADIDFTGYPSTEIGTSGISYEGTFDGQGHKITLGLVREGISYAALFRKVGSSSVIKNLITDGTITTNNQHAAGIAGETYGKILNCAAYVTINTTVQGDGTHGGITARTYNGSCIEFCLSAVKMFSEVTTNCGGVVGWMSGTCTMRNNLCIAELNFASEGSGGYHSDSFCRNSGNMTDGSGNNYFLNYYYASNASYCTQITEEQLASGEVCFLLNGDQSDIHWYQTIGEDTIPVLDNTHKQVCATGNLNCLARSADGSEIKYTNDYNEFIPKHNFEDGICSTCGNIQPNKCSLKDGYYQINNASDLAWFAALVKKENNNANAQLTADIDFTGYPSTEIGSPSIPFNGTFDGQGHKITLGIVRNGVNYAALFRTIGVDGIVKNLITDGTIKVNSKFAAGISGTLYGRLENCATFVVIESSLSGDNSSGGISAVVEPGSILESCLSAAVIEGNDNIQYCGGIVGWTDGAVTITNCLSIAEMSIAPSEQASHASDYICRRSVDFKVNSKNNYYLVTSDFTSYPNEAYCTETTQEQLQSGEICYLLNGDQSNIRWYQTIGEDPYPVPFPTSKQVYPTGNLSCNGQSIDGSPLTFSNTESSPIPDHQYEDGVCVVCGKSDPSACEEIDGFYQIGTANQLAWFAKRVSDGDANINAILLNDIDYSQYTDLPIGASGTEFNGILDGQGHTVRISFVTSTDYIGLVRYLGASGVVRNLNVEGNITSSARYSAGIAGNTYGTIQNCSSFVTIDCSYSGDATNGGIAGRSNGSTTEFCLSAVKIQAPNTIKCGGVIGWLDGTSTIRNCLCIAEMELSTFNESDAVCRNNGKLSSSSGSNFFLNLYGNSNATYCTQITKEQLATGEICYLLNGNQSDIHWYQSIGNDEYPTLYPESGRVYKINTVYGNAEGANGYNNFRNLVLEKEQSYCENVIAQQTYVEEYAKALVTLEQCSDIESFISTYNDKLQPLCDAVVKSEKAYSVFVNKVNETIAYLEANPALNNEKVDELKNYLAENEEPSDLFPNGTAPYILESGLLTEEEILAETEKIEPMLLEAILYSPAPGTNVTKLLVNPDFADSFNGWEGKKGTSVKGSPDNALFAGECWNNTMDMYQTVTDLQNGVYELQVNGAFRPYPSDNRYSTSYAAMLYANGVNNFFQADIEDMINAEDAVDGVNCHITGTNPDLAVSDIDGNIIGYIMYGQIGCCNAFSVGRYPNSVLGNVTDGTLTIGIKQPGTNNSNDWLGFGNVQLIYHGTIEEATEGLDNTLACMTARANTLVNVYEPNFGEDYQLYPNFPQALKDRLKETIEAVAAATDNAEKYKLIEIYSDLFQQVYEGKMAYVKLMRQATMLSDWMSELSATLTEDELSELTELSGYVSAGYIEGTFNAEEASKDYTGSLSFIPKQVDGVYQIGSATELAIFSDMVDGGENTANAVLTADIDFTMYPETEIGSSSKNYNGTFDGQGHKITLGIVTDADYAGIFQYLGSSGVVKNLITDGSITSTARYSAGIAGNSNGIIQNCASFITINCSYNGDATNGGIVGRANGATASFCLSAVKMDSPSSRNCGGVIGWLDGASTINNCLCIAEMTLSTNSESDAVCRHNGVMTAESGNNYFLNLYNTFNTNYCTQVSEEQIASGEICYQLNGDQSNIQWYQTIGEDAYPMPFAKQGGTVDKDENGLFINTAIQKIAANKLMRDGIYNLLGQKQQKTAKGVNIVDGKKVLVK